MYDEFVIELVDFTRERRACCTPGADDRGFENNDDNDIISLDPQNGFGESLLVSNRRHSQRPRSARHRRIHKAVTHLGSPTLDVQHIRKPE